MRERVPFGLAPDHPVPHCCRDVLPRDPRHRGAAELALRLLLRGRRLCQQVLRPLRLQAHCEALRPFRPRGHCSGREEGIPQMIWG